MQLAIDFAAAPALIPADTQAGEILAALQAGDQITPIDALERFRCFRLAARIRDLRQAGYHIKTEDVRLPNGKRIASYSLFKG